MQNLSYLLSVGLVMLIATTSTCCGGWVGEWVWHENEGEHGYLRRTFQVEGPVKAATLAITVDDIYKVYINGNFVGEDPEWWTVESYDISEHIQQGENLIAVHGTDPGGDLGAALADLVVLYETGNVTVVGTDSTWRLSEEIHEGWEQPGFDDSAWGFATTKARVPHGPWGAVASIPMFPQQTVAISEFSIIQEGISEPPFLPTKPFTVSMTFVPERTPLLEGDLSFILQFVHTLSSGEKFYEDAAIFTITPSFELTTIQPGVPQSVRFAGVYIPEYLPEGRFAAKMSGPGMMSESVMLPRFFPDPELPEVPQYEAMFNMPVLQDDRYECQVELDHPWESLSELQPSLGWFRGPRLEYVSHPTEPVNGTTINFAAPADQLPDGEYQLDLFLPGAEANSEGDLEVILKDQNLAPDHKPLGWGVYVDRYAVPHFWYINPGQTMIWDGAPYIPVGGMFLSDFVMGYNVATTARNQEKWDNDLRHLMMLRERGVTDIYLNPCTSRENRPRWLWQSFFELCEELGFHYGWQVTDEALLDQLKGFYVSTQDHTVPVHEAGPVRTLIPSTWHGRTSPDNRYLMAVFGKNGLVGTATATVLSWDEETGEATVEADCPFCSSDMEAHFVPEINYRWGMHDYWTNFVDDAILESWRDYIAMVPLGRNFRLFIDPLDNEQSLRDMHRLLPSSPAFQSQLATWLEDRYESLEALNAAWGLTPPVDSWVNASRLIPAGVAPHDNNLGWAVLLDDYGKPLQEAQYHKLNLTQSQMWYDMITFRDSSVAEFNYRAANILKEAHDAPVVLKLTESSTFVNPYEYGGFDGVGMEAYGTRPELVRGCGGGVYARALQSGRTIWELITETNYFGPDKAAGGYPDPFGLFKELSDMVHIGAKGAYIFVLAGGGDGGWQQFDLMTDMRQCEWLSIYGEALRSAPLLVDYKPKAVASFPALVSGLDGFNPPDPPFRGTGPHVAIRNKNGRWVIPVMHWENLPPDMPIITNLISGPASQRWASDWSAMLETVSDRKLYIVNPRLDLGVTPADRWYGELTTRADGRRIQGLFPPAGAEVLDWLPDQTPSAFRLGNLELHTLDDWDYHVRNLDMPIDPTEVFADVLEFDLLRPGPQIQRINAGELAYVWNMSSQDISATITTATGEYTTTLAAGAEHAARIPRTADISGLEQINRLIAIQAFEEAVTELIPGAQVSLSSDDSDWQSIWQEAELIKQRVHERSITTSAGFFEQITIDGQPDKWEHLTPNYVDIRVGTDIDEPTGRKDTWFKAARTPEGFALLVKVADEVIVNNYRGAQIWDGDAVEVYFETRLEPERARDAAYDSDCWRVTFAPTSADNVPVCRVDLNPGLPYNYEPRDIQYKFYITDTDYYLEVLFPPNELGGYLPEQGDTIGFNLTVGDSDGGRRQEWTLWQGQRDLTHNRTRFGRIYFAE